MPAIEIFQLDPELDTFSFAHYARLEDAQAEGLRFYRQHLQIRGEILEGAGATVGELAYVQVPQNSADPSRPDLWCITDSLHPDRHITMCQIARYHLIIGTLESTAGKWSRSGLDEELTQEQFRREVEHFWAWCARGPRRRGYWLNSLIRWANGDH